MTEPEKKPEGQTLVKTSPAGRSESTEANESRKVQSKSASEAKALPTHTAEATQSAKKNTPIKAASDGEKLATARATLPHRPKQVPVEGLADGVVNALGNGLGYALDTAKGATLGVASGIRSGIGFPVRLVSRITSRGGKEAKA